MYTVPQLHYDLVHTMLRFCVEPVTLVAEISEIFLQVEVDEEDRQYLRFLW